MLLENRTGTILKVTNIDPKHGVHETKLKVGEKAYYGDFMKDEILKIKSSRGSAIISMPKEEVFWENTDDDFIGSAVQSDGLLQLEEIQKSESIAWDRHLNGICIRVTLKEKP